MTPGEIIQSIAMAYVAIAVTGLGGLAFRNALSISTIKGKVCNGMSADIQTLARRVDRQSDRVHELREICARNHSDQYRTTHSNDREAGKSG